MGIIREIRPKASNLFESIPIFRSFFRNPNSKPSMCDGDSHPG